MEHPKEQTQKAAEFVLAVYDGCHHVSIGIYRVLYSSETNSSSAVNS